MMKVCAIILLAFFLLCSGDSFHISSSQRNKYNGMQRHQSAAAHQNLQKAKSSFLQAIAGESPIKSADAIGKEKAANVLGFVMGAGSMAVYAPIIFRLLKEKNAAGFAISTWIFNLLGLSCAITYPIKKGFPVSTYAETINAAIQCLIVLGLVCFYNGKLVEYLIGASLAILSFNYVIRYVQIPPKFLSVLQVASALISNYANIPQILLTFRTGKSSWSGITASLCLAGCLIRIFTTLRLTKDYLVLGGYLLGLVTNGILLAQVFLYK